MEVRPAPPRPRRRRRRPAARRSAPRPPARAAGRRRPRRSPPGPWRARRCRCGPRPRARPTTGRPRRAPRAARLRPCAARAGRPAVEAGAVVLEQLEPHRRILHVELERRRAAMPRTARRRQPDARSARHSSPRASLNWPVHDSACESPKSVGMPRKRGDARTTDLRRSLQVRCGCASTAIAPCGLGSTSTASVMRDDRRLCDCATPASALSRASWPSA